MLTTPIEFFTDVIDRYHEPHRHYHNWDHIQFMLRNFETIAPELLTGHGIMAIIYHDVCYDPKAAKGVNESASAMKFNSDFSDRYNDEFKENVSQIILGTIDHVPTGRLDFDVVFDLDLLGLGWDKETFDRNSVDIRKEYAHVTDEQWNIGRTAFFEKMLSRGWIYRTKPFAKFEQAARDNMQREINTIRAGG